MGIEIGNSGRVSPDRPDYYTTPSRICQEKFFRQIAQKFQLTAISWNFYTHYTPHRSAYWSQISSKTVAEMSAPKKRSFLRKAVGWSAISLPRNSLS